MLLKASAMSRTYTAEHQAVSGADVWVRRVVVVALSTLLLAVCAHISAPLPFTPVPLTMQTFAVLLVGMVLGPLEGLAVLLLYLAEGAVGLPVFSPQGLGGVAQLVGPSGGYLLSYPLAALLAGAVFFASRRFIPVFVASLTAAVIADAVILSSGAAWLASSLRLFWIKALEVGALPFLPGELLKALLIAIIVTALQRAKKTI